MRWTIGGEREQTGLVLMRDGQQVALCVDQGTASALCQVLESTEPKTAEEQFKRLVKSVLTQTAHRLAFVETGHVPGGSTNGN